MQYGMEEGFGKAASPLPKGMASDASPINIGGLLLDSKKDEAFMSKLIKNKEKQY